MPPKVLREDTTLKAGDICYRILVLLAFCAVIVAGIAGPGTNVEARTSSLGF
jgi:hypothetical protein